ncbi:MAG: BatA domain-containing protein, partial [Alphaproteobacteria bacterium]
MTGLGAGLGGLVFGAPWVLGALLLLPVIWWLLRVIPPAPKLVRFPPVRLLFGLSGREETPAKTPPWLIAFRIALALLLVVGLAQPLLNPET